MDKKNNTSNYLGFAIKTLFFNYFSLFKENSLISKAQDILKSQSLATHNLSVLKRKNLLIIFTAMIFQLGVGFFAYQSFSKVRSIKPKVFAKQINTQKITFSGVCVLSIAIINLSLLARRSRRNTKILLDALSNDKNDRSRNYIYTDYGCLIHLDGHSLKSIQDDESLWRKVGMKPGKDQFIENPSNMMYVWVSVPIKTKGLDFVNS
jgi:hypothetical protein